jgi:hypothetical protein
MRINGTRSNNSFHALPKAEVHVHLEGCSVGAFLIRDYFILSYHSFRLPCSGGALLLKCSDSVLDGSVALQATRKSGVGQASYRSGLQSLIILPRLAKVYFYRLILTWIKAVIRSVAIESDAGFTSKGSRRATFDGRDHGILAGLVGGCGPGRLHFGAGLCLEP